LNTRLTTKFRNGWLAALCVCLPVVLASADQAQNPQMVMLHVRVTDADGRAVSDVPQSSFQVTEDGVPQKIALFSNKEVPLSYGLVIDSSGSLRSQFANVVRAAQRIVKSNGPNDETFIVRFISSDKIEVVQEPISDKKRLLDGLDSLYIEGGPSAIIDATYLSAEKAAKTKNTDELRRRIVILVTDGEDRASFYKQEALFQFLAVTDVQIFTIALTKELKPEAADKAVRLVMKLGVETGGKTYFPTSAGDLEHIADQIINDIRTQYVIGYEPAGGDPKKDFHKVQVTIAENANQEKRVAITRVGYRTRK
jgi:Ca-activated chloride channel family protein